MSHIIENRIVSHTTLTDLSQCCQDEIKHNSEDDDAVLMMGTKRRVRRFSNSSNDNEPALNGSPQRIMDDSFTEKCEDNDESSTEHERDLNDKSEQHNNIKYNLSRTKKKKKKLRQKFEKLTTKQKNVSESKKVNIELQCSQMNKHNQNSDDSNDSCDFPNILDKKCKDREVIMSSLCDPDTSDSDEESVNIKQNIMKPHLTSVQPASPKSIRISAKQAMENMHKIKSESNRMLREKEISLPYHKPKALTLKDIMSRRKPALTADGKVLPVKMNAEQLQKYALMLEQRQREMIELCKSDTDNEEDTKDKQKNEDAKVVDLIGINIEESVKIKTMINDDVKQAEKVAGEINSEKNNTNVITSKSFNEALQNIPILNTYKSHNYNEEVNSCETVDDKFNDTEIQTIESEVQNQEDSLNPLENQILCTETTNIASKKNTNKQTNTENDSQMLNLYFESENEVIVPSTAPNFAVDTIPCKNDLELNKDLKNMDHDVFPENNFNYNYIDAVIESAESKENGDNSNQTMETHILTAKPKLTGAPGMMIDLVNNVTCEKKTSGVESLKERYTYFAKLKAKEDQEKDREKKFKPGTQHLKLKQELEQQIAEQRSLEWAKRLEQEKQRQNELNAIRGDESDIEDIEKIEAKLNENNGSNYQEKTSKSEGEEEEEDICEMKEKSRRHNPMIDDEAVESDIEDNASEANPDNDKVIDENEDTEEDIDASDEDSSDEDSSESDNDNKCVKLKKGRILKAFEDSDDESNTIKVNGQGKENDTPDSSAAKDSQNLSSSLDAAIHMKDSCNEVLNISGSQDTQLQLAQSQKSQSDFSYEIQISKPVLIENNIGESDDISETSIVSQTFSILYANNSMKQGHDIDNLTIDKETKSCSVEEFPAVNGVCPISLSQSILPKFEAINKNLTDSQEIGDDIVALCTGKFYDNPFISQSLEANHKTETTNDSNIEQIPLAEIRDKSDEKDIILKSIIDELDDPKFESEKKYKYFFNSIEDKKNKQNTVKSESKKKLVIESEDDDGDNNEVHKSKNNNKKKGKKRKRENRVLQISDDEEDYDDVLVGEGEETASEIEDDTQQIVEYDSEENEIPVIIQNPKKKQKSRGLRDFFEQEAELTSEDEWVGSGDEDESGLDRMEREEGDNDIFQEGKLQRELGQIHMRDVLDQDKREVRIIQELLFEDGDLGDGHRQRKFRWRNADDAVDGDGRYDEFADTQEEEFESEEQWRKQRHERELFLRKMKDEENTNVNTNGTTIIKDNLCSRIMTNLLSDSNLSNAEATEASVVSEKQTHRDIPSSRKTFPIYQQSYRGSFLSRGTGALARLAAIATPLAGNDDAPKVSAPTNRRNFVFATLTQDESEPKVSKRKADPAVTSPALIKKMKTAESKNNTRNSLFDCLEV